MEADRWVWIGGEAEPMAPEEARIEATDYGYLYGSAIYETLRTYHSRPFALGDHLDRLARGAERAGFGTLPLAAMERAMKDLASRRSPEESYLRLTVSPGAQFPGWSRPPEGPVRWTAFAGPLAPHVAAVYERGVRCVVASRPRWNPGGFIPAVKFAANPELRLARLEAEEAGAYEAILMNTEGFVAECSSSNLFIVMERRVVTPDLGSGILDGVTRQTVLHLTERAGLPAQERSVTLAELLAADEVFLASTLKEIVPVVAVDDRTIGNGAPGLITDRLLGLFQEHALNATRGE
jgi:branched-chain amino acid aminotransferase